MRDKLPAIGGREALFYFPQEPFVIVDQPLDGFDHQ